MSQTCRLCLLLGTVLAAALWPAETALCQPERVEKEPVPPAEAAPPDPGEPAPPQDKAEPDQSPPAQERAEPDQSAPPQDKAEPDQSSPPREKAEPDQDPLPQDRVEAEQGATAEDETEAEPSGASEEKAPAPQSAEAMKSASEAGQLSIGQPQAATDTPAPKIAQSTGTQPAKKGAEAVGGGPAQQPEPPTPLDLSPQVSGVLQASVRATFFDKESYVANEILDEEASLDDDFAFQLDHTHIRLYGHLSQQLFWEVRPCLTHLDDFSIMTALFGYEIHRAFRITAGRFLLPFGQFNLRSLPGDYDTLSRPLLYQSHEDGMIQFPDRTPSNLLFTPRDDTGLLLSGSTDFGTGDVIDMSWDLYITNGLRSASNTGARFWDDNNNGKQFGGRLGGGWNWGGFRAQAGASLLSNVYEDNALTDEGLDQRAVSLDGVISLAYFGERRVTLRGEYVYTIREIQPNVMLSQGDEAMRGGYVTVDVDVLENLNAYYQFDTLTERSPRVFENSPITDLDDELRDLNMTTHRHTGGISLTVFDPLVLRAEYGRWLEPEGTSHAHRASIQTVVTF